MRRPQMSYGCTIEVTGRAPMTMAEWNAWVCAHGTAKCVAAYRMIESPRQLAEIVTVVDPETERPFTVTTRVPKLIDGRPNLTRLHVAAIALARRRGWHEYVATSCGD